MAKPTPIRLRNLPRWIARTRELDDRLHERSARRRLGGRLPRVLRPLFVIGAPRSGTSFLGDACGALPEFSYHYEPPMTKAAGRYVYEGRWSPARARLFYRLTYAWLSARHGESHLRFAEKTPQNVFVLPFLRDAFPDAQFVHILRDGRDAALSYADKPWLTEAGAATGKRESGGYRFGPYARYWVEPARRDEFESTGDLHRCAWAWRRHVEAGLAGRELLDDRRYHEVRYEELVTSPRDVAERLLDFLGIQAASRDALHERLAHANRSSVGRWRESLDDEQRALVEREAGKLLRQLGYGAEER